jgi:HK97 family phage major capsid protein
MDSELKEALHGAQKLNEEFKATHKVVSEQIEKTGRASAELSAKVDKINEDVIAKVEAAQARYDELERRLNRGELFGGAGDKAEAKALELKAFNLHLASFQGLGAQAVQPLSAEAYFGKYKPAFLAYIRGKESAVQQLGPDFMAVLNVGSDPSGGYAVPVDITDRVVSLIYETSAIRKRAAIRTTSRDRIQIRRDLDQAVLGGWVAEQASRAATNTPQIPVPYEIPVHEGYAFPLLSQQELSDAAWDVEAWLVQKLSERYSRDENAAFAGGNGVGKPRGFLTYASAVPSKTAFEKVEQVKTGVNGNFAAAPNGPDIFIDLMGKMKEDYLGSASWAMTRTTLAAARKLKDSQGRYQVELEPGLNGRPGFSILGFEVDRWADMPEIASGSLSIALANWAQAYQIVDHASGMSSLRDPYTQKPNIGVYTIKRVGGDVANFEAIKLAQFSA